MTTDVVSQLAYFHGKPQSSGELRTQMSDFKVFEQLPFAPCGEGEHLYIHIRKTGANTVYVARQLAKYFKVKEALVSYAGLKDRFAVTEQWFGVHVPGKQVYDLSDLVIDGVEVLAYARHNKKLKTGALTGNRFEITLRNVTNIESLKQKWQQIIAQGVPNYFGEQRFGIDGGNIARAGELFAGTKVKDKKKRGIYLSAARSYLFNQAVSQRIEDNTFDVLAPGDVCMLAGTQSVFLAEEIDELLKGRLRDKDIDITAPMWGAGELKTTGAVLAFEQELMAQHPDFCQGLAKFGLKQERRRIRLNVAGTDISTGQDSVTLTFSLPSGCYATTILRELVDYTDLTERAVGRNQATADETKPAAG
ncbi:tRNA pseudouridine(13) synthase TruD [Thalassomonas actiniarum]|uniref:tRNA pseudouridine synthase D n=1 Tax=Thalassomonas actiniarum TaxID=485447 RepID=A0AAE9YV30_9GAMM|nr:tRNA pseudouridine(13) synthase TruD [Thalassomonas actiniarum]WDE00053.1 tRNA pseudouridine(13) synthase TruD [Thalassomonas actiniarum]